MTFRANISRDREAEVRRHAATEYYMQQIETFAASGLNEAEIITYVKVSLTNWRSRMAQIDAGGF